MMDQIEPRRSLETALIGGAGALLLLALRVPAGPILGAITFTAVAALAGRRLGWATPVTTAIFLTTGFAAGATVTPATLQAAALWPLSILTLAATSGVTWAAAWWVCRRLSDVDSKTAFFATAPGSLAAVMALAEQDRADVPRIAVAQSLRLLALVAAAPFAMSLPHVPPPAPEPAMIDGALAWVLAVAAALAGWRLAVWRRLPAPVFLGAFLGSAVLHATGVVAVRAPQPVLLAATAALGALIGSRFSGVRMRDLMRFLPATLAQIAVMAAISLPVGIVVGMLSGVGPAAGLLAFAPGSMEMMIAIALALNAHPAYVVAHHLSRTLMLLALVPILAARWGPRTPPPAPAPKR
jgi:membrane AbrB-like protein